MTLALIVKRSLRQHALSTTITALSIALAGGLLMSVWVVKDQSLRTFTQVNTGFDAVLGARGSKLQLVLPIAVGDNLRGYRIVGTIPELFTDVEYAQGRHFKLADGRLFDPDAKE